MKVSYVASNRRRSRTDTDGVAIKTGWRFLYAGRDYVIPAVYLFQKGFVVDIIGKIDTNALRAFYERYEQRGEHLTPYEHAQAMLEHPYQMLEGMKLWFNGEEVLGSSHRQEALYMPWQEHHMPLAKEAMEAYVLEQDKCFFVTRVHAPYPKGSGVMEAIGRMWKRPLLKSLRFVFNPTERMLPLSYSLTLDLDEKQMPELAFTHPVTGTLHTLRVTQANWEDLSAQFQKMYRMLKRKKRIRHTAGEYPGYVLCIGYTLTPQLPQGERLQLQDANVMLQLLEHRDASGIGVIGSADGPTVIFRAGGERRSMEHNACFSNVYPSPQPSCTIDLAGIWTQKEPQAEFAFTWNDQG